MARSLNTLLESGNITKLTALLELLPSSVATLTDDQLQLVFDAIESVTSERDETLTVNKRAIEDATIENAASSPPQMPTSDVEFRSNDPARYQMTQLYQILKKGGRLNFFGAVGRWQEAVFPTAGSKLVSEALLEEITEMNMISLTPQPTNLLLYQGVGLAVSRVSTIGSTSIGWWS